MTSAEMNPSPRHEPLRLWPGVVAAALLLVVRFGVPLVDAEFAYIGVLGGAVCALVILGWWAFFSRIPRLERWGGLLLVVVALAVTPNLLHASIRTGMMGMMYFMYAIPVVSLALVAWALAFRGLADGPRRVALVAVIVAACCMWALLRTDGILGGGGSEFAWRWSPTAEERLLAEAGEEDVAAVSAPVAPPPVPGAVESPEEQSQSPADRVIPDSAAGADEPGSPTSVVAENRAGQPGLPDGKINVDPNAGDEVAELDEDHLAGEGGDRAIAHSAARRADWPGFRGPGRDGVVRGVRIATDWSASPPVELWRRPVGPGWSSLAVDNGLLYTQEQRGEEEVVSCYRMSTGEPVWMHRDATRFWESNAGAGPRGTPTVRGGRVYSVGGTGFVNALDAHTGAVVWSRNLAADTGKEVPYWGFASSPLVLDDLVVAAAAGQLIAYDLATGEPRWSGPDQGDGYSSPQQLTVDGVEQVVLLSGAGAVGVDPADGSMLWEHEWGGFASLQPGRTADGDLLLAVGAATGGLGTRRLALAKGSSGAAFGWTLKERWTSKGLKPYFNDFVVHEGHAYGFDGRILSCIDLENGDQQWKGGRFGNGQMIVLADQDVLVVLSDTGELGLVRATPGEFEELARIQVIEGKTWNHPAMVGDVLLVRNDQEMAAFRLARAGE